ncbi:Capsule synthesis protein CapA domain-containing protein [Burkholderia pseudomallei]|nr:polyglutamate synthase [Burkholderia pseudomallei]VBP34339.1 polyglutamate synthase [Burkholderia pseudomallei]
MRATLRRYVVRRAGAPRAGGRTEQFDGDGRRARPSGARGDAMNETDDAPLHARVRLFLCGDVMTGRGIDQILPHPGAPRLYERYCRSARDYVRLAERANGELPARVDCAYPWGDALAELDRVRPHVRIVNLETAITTSDARWPDKAVLYRMHPRNVGCVSSARIDCCVLANNHSLDWGREGLADTLDTLRRAGIRTAGAGDDDAHAARPATLGVAPGRRVLVYAYAAETSGVPPSWAATPRRGGLNYLADLSSGRATQIGERIAAQRREGDLVVVSLHWGGNWGFEIGDDEHAFAHRLIDTGAADIVYGHSSHHVKGIEIYRERLILYGCGDCLNDYEGIHGHQPFRPDLALMYFPVLDAGSGALVELSAVPMQIRNLRLQRAPADGKAWLHAVLERESRRFGTHVSACDVDGLHVHW